MAFRENCELPENGWSLWVRAMIPALGEDRDFIPRGGGHVGYKNKNTKSAFGAYVANCGIYEWKAVRADQPSRVVYVGSTCKATDTLQVRISEYCNHGFHKKALINDALSWGYELWVRVKPTGIYYDKAAAAEAENALLAQYDYAWNIRNNAAVRSILMPHRPLRETRELPSEDEWSSWEIAMVPHPDEDFEEREGNVGYRRKGIGSNLTADYSCGIYEWQARKAGQPDRVVCVGSACRSKGESLGDRIREEYCVERSRKGDLINDALKREYELWVRFKVIETDAECAEDHENSLLAQFDYAWNTRNILP